MKSYPALPHKKLKLDPNYYPPTYIPKLEDAPALVDNLVPALTLGKDDRRREDTQKEHRRKIQKNPKDYYSDSGYIYQSYV